MPIYEYECEQCGVRFERLQRMSEDSLQQCPECNGHVHRVMQPVGVIFKGSGFYVTDNRGRSSTGVPPAKHEESKGSSSETSSSSAAPEKPAASAKVSATADGGSTKSE